MGLSPLHSNTVGLIRNPKTNRISPQFHCVYDNDFETVNSNDPDHPPPCWEDLVINSQFWNDLEGDNDLHDDWERPSSSVPKSSSDVPVSEVAGQYTNPPADNVSPSEATKQREPTAPPRQEPEVPATPEPPEPIQEDVRHEDDASHDPQLRRSTRMRNKPNWFCFDKATGYSAVCQFTKALVVCLAMNTHNKQVYEANFRIALAMDHDFGTLDGTNNMPPDFLN